MTSVKLDPELIPVRLPTEDEIRAALKRLIVDDVAHAAKLERMALWDDARAMRRDIMQLEAFLRTGLAKRLSEELQKESKMK